MTTVHAQTGIKLATKPAKTSLLGGHFIYKANGTTETPSSANVVEWVDNDPTLWRHNVHIGSNGIKLRYGETTLSKWDTNSLIFYKPKSVLMTRVKEKTFPHNVSVNSETFLSQINTIGDYQFIFHQGQQWTYNEEEVEIEDYGITLTAVDGASTAEGQYITIEVYNTNVQEKGIQLTSAGLGIFGSSQSRADVTVTSSGINIGKGSVIGADNTVTNYVPDTGFLYLSTKNYGSYLNVANSGNRTDWRLVVGNNFGVTKDGNVYMSAATVSGKIVALTGQIGGTYAGDSWGWTLSIGQLYTGTIGTDNSLHMRSFNLSSDVSINGESRKDWRLTVGSKFGVTKNGEIFATDANLSGIVNANEGSIGGAEGWRIVAQKIYNGTPGTYGSIYLSTANPGHSITINNHSRTDWAFTVGNNFGVTRDGYVFAKDAEIDGKIIATSGTIGAASATNKITIGENTTNASIYYGMDSLTSTNNGFYIGTNGISVGGGKFKVTASGQITATGLSISASNIEGVLTRNYVVNGFFDDTTISSPWSKESSATLSYSNGMLVITCSSSYYGIYQAVTLEPNTKYVLSCDAGSSFQLGFGASNSWPTYTGAWTTASDGRKYRIVETSSDTTYRVYAYANGSSSPCYINRIKLEIGEKYTGWYAGGDENTEGGYITDISYNGIQITSKGNSGNYLTLDSSNGMRIYKNGGQVAQFGDTINLSSSYGDLQINSTGLNINTAGTAVKAITFNQKPLLSMKGVTYTLANDIPINGMWKIRKNLPDSIINYYTVLGVVGYDFNNVDLNNQQGISMMNVYECCVTTGSGGNWLNFGARNTTGHKITKAKMNVIIYLLVTPKISNYVSESLIDTGGTSDSDES